MQRAPLLSFCHAKCKRYALGTHSFFFAIIVCLGLVVKYPVPLSENPLALAHFAAELEALENLEKGLFAYLLRLTRAIAERKEREKEKKEAVTRPWVVNCLGVVRPIKPDPHPGLLLESVQLHHCFSCLFPDTRPRNCQI